MYAYSFWKVCHPVRLFKPIRLLEISEYKNGHILKASHKIVITYNLDDIDFVICCMDSAKLGLRATMGFLIGASSSASEPEIALTLIDGART